MQKKQLWTILNSNRREPATKSYRWKQYYFVAGSRPHMFRFPICCLFIFWLYVYDVFLYIIYI